MCRFGQNQKLNLNLYFVKPIIFDYFCNCNKIYFLKKTKNIPFKVFLLLLIYIICNSPAILFHHHDTKIVAFENANTCEKVIYYSHSKQKCNHKSHLTTSQKKCFLCDNHTLTPYISESSFYNFFKTYFGSRYQTTTFEYTFATISILANRGPPLV